MIFAEPEHNIEQLGLSENEIVADFGAGSGAYTLAAARALHGTGRVYAIEVQKGLLLRIENAAKEAGLSNVAVIWGDLEHIGGTKLRDSSVGCVIISNVLFQADEKEVIIRESQRILRTGGRLLVIDWTGSFGSLGPQATQVFSEHLARELIEGVGYTFDRPISAGSYHYGLVFRKGGVRPENLSGSRQSTPQS